MSAKLEGCSGVRGRLEKGGRGREQPNSQSRSHIIVDCLVQAGRSVISSRARVHGTKMAAAKKKDCVCGGFCFFPHAGGIPLCRNRRCYQASLASAVPARLTIQLWIHTRSRSRRRGAGERCDRLSRSRWGGVSGIAGLAF